VSHPAIADRRLIDRGEIWLVPRAHALMNLMLSELIDMGNQVLVARRFNAKAREERQGRHSIAAPPSCERHNVSFIRLTHFHETPSSRVAGVTDRYTIHTKGVQYT
jgi:hypothetical protein